MNNKYHFLIIGLILSFLIILAGGVWFYKEQEKSTLQETQDDLLVTAQLKAQQIINWRNERISDGEVIMENPLFIQGVEKWMADPTDENLEPIRTHLTSLRENYHYTNIVLTHASGQILFDLSGSADTFHAQTLQVIQQALEEHKTLPTELYVNSTDQGKYIDIVTPLFSNTADTPEAIGAVICSIDANQYLYPLIQYWPSASETAETLLVRKDGDAALFLNELRHQQDTALKLRIPIGQTEIPAAMAVSGQEGPVAGLDYRGVEVLAYIIDLPDSDWYMIAKVDKEEAFSNWRFRAALISIIIFGCLLGFAISIGFIRQRDRNRHYRMLLDAEKAQHISEMRFKTTLLSVGDGVIATDAEGKIMLMNPVAETLTGWAWDQAHNKPLDEIFNIVNEESLQKVENPVRAVLREGKVVGLANHTLLLAKNGEQYPIADSGAPIFDENGEISGVVLVFRDQTHERAFITALQKSEEQYVQLFTEMQTGFALHELICDEKGEPQDYRFLNINPAFEKITGLCGADLIGKTVRTVLPGTEDYWIQNYGKVALTGEPIEFEQFSADLGKYYEVRAFSPKKGYFATLFLDTTKRKEMEKLVFEKEKMAGIGRLAAGIAHEINTPLQVITGISETSKKRLEEKKEVSLDDLERKFETINHNAWRIANIIRSLLDYSRENKRDSVLCSLNQVVAKTLLLVEHQLKSWGNITIKTSFAENIPEFVCDPNQLTQVLINMINNAQDSMLHGGTIQISTDYDETERNVILRISDTGFGIPEEHLNKIFEPFFTTKPIGKGTGLGLSIAVGIIGAHGGTIAVEKTSREGTTFKITLPSTSVPID